jgi:hypothetical protein
VARCCATEGRGIFRLPYVKEFFVGDFGIF